MHHVLLPDISYTWSNTEKYNTIALKSSNFKLCCWHFHTTFALFQKWTQGRNRNVIPHQLHGNKQRYNYMIKNEFYLCFSMHEIYILPAWFVNRLLARSGGQFLISHLISACTVPWSAPVSHWSLPDKHLISAWWAMWSVPDQPRHQCMRSHVISAW